MSNHWLSVIVFAPLIGAAICWLAGRRIRSEAFIGTVACASVGVSTVIAFVIALTNAGGAALTNDTLTPVFSHLWTWMEVGRFRADYGFAMDRLSAIYTCFVTFVGLLIHVFATGYMHGDKSFYRFFAYLNLFMFMMLTLVLADNLLLMFVGWEGVGLCSYLLIGYYIDRREAGDAAKKAFVANRVGDWGVILGIMLVFFLTGSISFFDKSVIGEPVTSALAAFAQMPVDPFTAGALIAGGVTSAALLLFIGATGKSAQIPLFVWLPDAMAGPTPVSALIHAATMVTAGVYLIVRCSQIYVHAPAAMFVVAIIGALTAIFAATIGIAQNDIKKVLAYSTISQLGYMMLACGVGAFVAAIFHVMTHAFFKALLFLGSGSVIHGMHHEQDMRRMGGLRKYMPITFATMLTGWLAISGIPIFAGFFSKDEILWKTWSTEALAIPEPAAKILWIVGALTALITAFYMTRLMVMTFWGAERFREAHAGGQADDAHAQAYDKGHAPHDAATLSVADDTQHAPGGVMHEDEDEDHGHHHGPVTPHESPLVMTLPLIILAILSTIGGLVGIPYALSGGAVPNYFERALEPIVAHAPQHGGADEYGAQAAAAIATGATAHGVASPEMLSPAPQPHDGAAPVTVGEGTHGPGAAAATEHAHDPSEVRMERIFSGISVAIALLGIGLGWLLFGRKPLLAMPRLLENKYYVDEAYDAAIINPIKVGSREGLWKIFDVGVIDGLVNGLARGTREIGTLARQIQPGFVRSYAA
ncbi:MAG: NADH-quinone oxidoreductase subunit L, partial [Pyrinomonadaceae bacterium]|nr:NADH-quinone oxidoreductase subunit L [Pyrinomonadaceae bacterium]